MKENLRSFESAVDTLRNEIFVEFSGNLWTPVGDELIFKHLWNFTLKNLRIFNNILSFLGISWIMLNFLQRS